MADQKQKKVWFITGCSSGFGKELVNQLVAKGEQVVATARRVESLDYITDSSVLKLKLDVTDKSQVESAVKATIDKFGKIDVLINNAGYGQIGAFEEVSDEEIRVQYETNVFGVMTVTRAVLPHMRKAKSGHIQVLSSIGGLVAGGGFSIYNSTKFAMEGFFEGLAQEVAHLGIKATIVEPGPFRTEFLGGSIKVSGTSLPDYETGAAATSKKYAQDNDGKQAGDPAKAAEFMIEVAQMEQPPLRLLLGKSALSRYKSKLENELKNLETFGHYATDADFK
jgi:NAD(P)-dependent dehydrogenase (short-subunit alcohol dehydrogenase family)